MDEKCVQCTWKSVLLCCYSMTVNHEYVYNGLNETMFTIVCMDMDYSLLFKGNIDYNEIHWQGKYKYIIIGYKQIYNFWEINNQREYLIHALGVNSHM